MDPRVGVTEARFLQGMGYVIVDATTEAIMFAALIYYMRRVLAIDPMRVGWYTAPFTFILAQRVPCL